MKSDDEGFALDRIWLTDLRGRKLSDRTAEDVTERLQDYLVYCQPQSTGGTLQEYKCGDIEVSNTAHPKLTQVTVTADLYSPGLLLQLASVMHGQGISVAEAVIRGGVDNPIPAELTQIELPDPPPGKRVLRFWVADIRDHAKLDYSAVSALVFTMGLVMGHGQAPTTPPNKEINITGYGQGPTSVTSVTNGTESDV
eukprot:jgi/Chrzof1/13866/Cz08g15160.t1